MSTDEIDKLWIAFKYENLPGFCFHCGKMGHGFKDCPDHPFSSEGVIEDEFPFSSALKANSVLMGKEWYKNGGVSNRFQPQRLYVGCSAVSKNAGVSKISIPVSSPVDSGVDRNRKHAVVIEPVLERKILESKWEFV